MTFPTVVDADTSSGSNGTNSQTGTITACTNIQQGDLLLCWVAQDGSTGGAATLTGFTSLFQGGDPGNSVSQLIFGKQADGTESGASLTLDIGAGHSEQWCWRMYRITGWFGGNISGSNDGISVGGIGSTSATPNPPARDPAAWDVEDTLWIAAAAVDASRSLTGFPASYTNTVQQNGGANGATLGLARRNNAVASEDPGTFACTSDDWVCTTLAVRPGVYNKQALLNINQGPARSASW